MVTKILNSRCPVYHDWCTKILVAGNDNAVIVSQPLIYQLGSNDSSCQRENAPAQSSPRGGLLRLAKTCWSFVIRFLQVIAPFVVVVWQLVEHLV